jgi:hypothetical protein
VEAVACAGMSHGKNGFGPGDASLAGNCVVVDPHCPEHAFLRDFAYDNDTGGTNAKECRGGHRQSAVPRDGRGESRGAGGSFRRPPFER